LEERERFFDFAEPIQRNSKLRKARVSPGALVGAPPIPSCSLILDGSHTIKLSNGAQK